MSHRKRQCVLLSSAVVHAVATLRQCITHQFLGFLETKIRDCTNFFDDFDLSCSDIPFQLDSKFSLLLHGRSRWRATICRAHHHA